ncbi:hypothetical protein EDC94DRAFT_648682 [Helicostylum pulchrum]|nr:hypothetical protein EDC94DRAFT_648682 [Helicostylum pulchrum]
MASQRNNVTLLEVQMLLQRTIMNESQSILGKLDNLGATINDLREEAIAAKEENMSLKEELSLKNKINMIYSSVGNNLSVSSPRFAGEATGSETYHKLTESVIGRSMTKEEFDGCCEDSVIIGVLNPVMYTIKKRHDLLKKPINFAKLPSDVREEAELLLEEKAAPFLPLAACTGRWGEKMLLMRMWHRTSQYYIDEDEEGENRVAAQTILRQEEQEEQEEDVHKEEDIQNFTDTDPFEDLENPIVEGPLLERAEVCVLGEAATKAIQRKRGRPSTKKKTTVSTLLLEANQWK